MRMAVIDDMIASGSFRLWVHTLLTNLKIRKFYTLISYSPSDLGIMSIETLKCIRDSFTKDLVHDVSFLWLV